jgi:hypothetical protein
MKWMIFLFLEFWQKRPKFFYIQGNIHENAGEVSFGVILFKFIFTDEISHNIY